MKGISGWKLVFGVILAILIVVGFSWARPIYSEMQAMKAPNYEQGSHKGAVFCGQCHREIYEAWSTRSLHAVATTKPSFKDYLNKFNENFLLGTFVTDAVCYACHGQKTNTEGVNCEICHGTVLAGEPIMVTHEKKYQPGMDALRDQEFCAICHDIRSPLSKDHIFTVQGEWRNSKAAAAGKTCQSCHMQRSPRGVSYHGFDSAHLDETIYQDELLIRDVRLNFPDFQMVVENTISAHALPPSGPTRVMGMTINFHDKQGQVIHRIQETFTKKFKLMPIAGLFPNRLINNTQLQSNEARPMSYTLPSTLKGEVRKAVISFRFYGVSDEHQGDIHQAHWISKAIFQQEYVY